MAAGIDEYSLTSSMLTLLCKGKEIGTATGFISVSQGRAFLITNWHVLSGRNCHTGQPISREHAIPDAVQLLLHVREPFGKIVLVTFQVLDEDDNPRWIMHPAGQEVDVAALELGDLAKPIAAYSLPMPGQAEDMRIQVSQDVFVLGYPNGISHNGIFPVWKRASIATEPEFDLLGGPFFLVDTATRQGMSGSPVIARSFGSYITQNGDTGLGGVFTRFIGVYSGRLGAASQEDGQLGVVWKASVIGEIIRGGNRGSYVLRDA